MHATGSVRTTAIALCLLGATIGLTACGGGPGTGGGTASASAPSAPSPRPSSTAKITIVSPTNGETITGSTVDVKVKLEGATIVAATTTNIRPDQGHLHLYLDGQIVSMNYQLTDVLHDVSPGQHLLRIEFVASDHAPFDPRVFQQLIFTVKP